MQNTTKTKICRIYKPSNTQSSPQLNLQNQPYSQLGFDKCEELLDLIFYSIQQYDTYCNIIWINILTKYFHATNSPSCASILDKLYGDYPKFVSYMKSRNIFKALSYLRTRLSVTLEELMRKEAPIPDISEAPIPDISEAPMPDISKVPSEIPSSEVSSEIPSSEKPSSEMSSEKPSSEASSEKPSSEASSEKPSSEASSERPSSEPNKSSRGNKKRNKRHKRK